MNLHSGGLGKPSNTKARDAFWRGLWKLNIPGVVAKQFLWKTCQDILPTRVNLAKKKFTVDVNCPIFKIKEETLIHVLQKCPAARDVWGEKDSPLHKWVTKVSGFLDLCALISHNIWLRRNSYVFRIFLQILDRWLLQQSNKSSPSK